MNDVSAPRDGMTIVKDIHALTTSMLNNRDNEDLLIEGIDSRQDLIDEYELLSAKSLEDSIIDEKDQQEFKKIINLIIEMDKNINASLELFKAQAKENVQNSNKQQKILSYTNNAMSSSGSYMDFKK